MQTQTSRHHFDNQWLHSVLSEIGYRLEDNGDHWRTSALFRGGSNNTSLMVFKNTGVWKDFADTDGYLPFSNLIEKSTDALTAAKILEGKNITETVFRKTSLIKMEKIYPDSVLKRFIPHFNFYTKRDISADLLKELKAGYASGDNMYQRIVFPIFNKEGKIHGFSGRLVFWKEDDTKPKWKHMGEKKNWVYPFFSYPKTAAKIEETKTVFLVESIGDAMAMISQGHENVIVLFSLSMGAMIISHLVAMGVNEIIVSTNKDKDGYGQAGAAKIVGQLLAHFDFAAISVLLPMDNDIHLMHMKGRDFSLWIEGRKRGINALKWATGYKDNIGKFYPKIEKTIKFNE